MEQDRRFGLIILMIVTLTACKSNKGGKVTIKTKSLKKVPKFLQNQKRLKVNCKKEEKLVKTQSSSMKVERRISGILCVWCFDKM